MPAITVENTLALPRLIPEPSARSRSARIVTAHFSRGGAGLPVWRPFHALDPRVTDPFYLLAQGGPFNFDPGKALGSGTTWHPHRGFETVSYIIDGEIAHQDSFGGGGLIKGGDLEWMTAGSGILHDEQPSERFVASGGWSHMIQLWVNLPGALKMIPPRYQAIEQTKLCLFTSSDGGALIRLISGRLLDVVGPAQTHTPIFFAHATLSAGAEVTMPWNPQYNALAFVLGGEGYVGPDRHPIAAHELALCGEGDAVTIGANSRQQADVPNLDVLLIGGLPIQEPIAHRGPFVMNTEAELRKAFEDFEAGKMGVIPAVAPPPR
jgi:redox-sensitive bicupin YhaK (pirin superfamily)